MGTIPAPAKEVSSLIFVYPRAAAVPRHRLRATHFHPHETCYNTRARKQTRVTDDTKPRGQSLPIKSTIRQWKQNQKLPQKSHSGLFFYHTCSKNILLSDVHRAICSNHFSHKQHTNRYTRNKPQKHPPAAIFYDTRTLVAGNNKGFRLPRS